MTGITLSAEQLAFARERIARAGLQEPVTLALCDFYRDLEAEVRPRGPPIEMFKAVGRSTRSGYFETLDPPSPGGRAAALQVITIDETRFDAYATNPGETSSGYIFPGGMLPTAGTCERAAAATAWNRARDPLGSTTPTRWPSGTAPSPARPKVAGCARIRRRKADMALSGVLRGGFRSRHIDVVQTVLHKP